MGMSRQQMEERGLHVVSEAEAKRDIARKFNVSSASELSDEQRQAARQEYRNLKGSIRNTSTGQAVAGWRDPDSGRISTDPKDRLGSENAVPIYGTDTLRQQVVNRGT